MRKNNLLLGFLGVLLLMEFFIIVPYQFSILVKTSRAIKSKENDLKNLERDINNKPQLLQQKDSMSKEIEALKKRFLSKGDLNLVISRIDAISRDMGLDIPVLKPQVLEELRKTPEGKFYSLPILLNLNSGYHKLAQFINKLENLDFYLGVKELVIKGEYPDTKVELLLWAVARE